MKPTDLDWLRRQAPVLCIAGLFLVSALSGPVSLGPVESAQTRTVEIGRPLTPARL